MALKSPLRQMGVPLEQQRSRLRPATLTFAVACLFAVPFLMYRGRSQSFFIDDFDFLAARHLSNVSDLMRQHYGHWSTLPIIEYRFLFSIFGINHVWPYRLVNVMSHISVALLLYIVMRRAQVHPWISSVAGIVFLYFGGGWVDILWSFQIGFTSALAFGLAFLILVDHADENQTRDVLGFLCGMAALMCSGIGVAMVAAAAGALLLRRGWQIALRITVPLGVIFLLWYAVYGRVSNPSSSISIKLRFFWDIVTNPFSDISYVRYFGWVLAAVLIGGVLLALRRHPWSVLRQRYSVIAGLLLGDLVFMSVTTMSRGWSLFFATSLEGPRASRYAYVGVALVVPAVAAAASELSRGRPILIVLAALVLLVGFVGNVEEMHPLPGFSVSPAEVAALAVSPVIRTIAPGTVINFPFPNSGGFVTAGWLKSAERSGKLPTSSINVNDEAQAALILSIQNTRRKPAAASCQNVASSREIAVQSGQTIVFPVGVTSVSVLENGRPVAPAVRYTATGLFGDQYFSPTSKVTYLRFVPQRSISKVAVC